GSPLCLRSYAAEILLPGAPVYVTFKVSFMLLLVELSVAVTVTVYVPAGVPPCEGGEDEPPLQDTSILDSPKASRSMTRRLVDLRPASGNPAISTANASQGVERQRDFKEAEVRAVVVRVTVNDVVAPEVALTELGTEHVTVAGAPVQVRL